MNVNPHIQVMMTVPEGKHAHLKSFMRTRLARKSRENIESVSNGMYPRGTFRVLYAEVNTRRELKRKKDKDEGSSAKECTEN